MKIRSLKTRISLCIAGLMVIVVGILSGVAYHEFRESLWGSMDLTLQSDLLQIKGLLLSGDPLGAEVQREIQIFLNPKSGMQKIEYQLWFENAADETVETLIASDICETLTAKGVAPPKQDALKLVDLERNQKTFRVLWARYQVPNTPASSPTVLNIALAISSKNAIHEVGEFVRIMVILGCIIVWAAFGLTQQILRWGLRPIDNLADWMSRISEGNLKTVNLEHSAFHRELKPFIKSWEAMLNRLADAMQEQKRFTADAAHELKTPVALIKSTLQLAQSQKRTTDFYETAIANALEDVERLNHLISGLLDLSRLESGESAGRREMIHLKDIIEQVCDAYAAFLSTRELSLTRMLCDADITGNDSQIAQLFGNLIDNAVKYAPPNTEITVSMQINNGTVLTTVHDAGGNIPEDECKLLFNRFYRIEKGRDRDSGGSGLGLAIAREIAAIHGGGIEVTSNPRWGTSFLVTLPLHMQP